MNSTVGWLYTLHSVMFNAPTETEMAAFQTTQVMHGANISLINLLVDCNFQAVLMW